MNSFFTCITFILSVFLFSAKAAEVKFTSGHLYELPYAAQEKIFLELDYPQEHLQDPETIKALDMECSSLQNFLRRTNLNTQVAKDSYNSLRKSPFRREISYSSFAVRFRVQLEKTINSLFQNTLQSNQVLNRLNFDQTKQEQSNIELTNSNFGIVNLANNSLTSMATKAGMDLLPIELANGTSYPMHDVGDRTVTFPVSAITNDQLKFYVRGRDTFCDLMAGKIAITNIGSGSYLPNQDDYNRVTDFYNRSVSTAVEEVFNIQKSVVGRSAILGHKFGAMIKTESDNPVSEPQVIAKISVLINQLFDPSTFERNDLWQNVYRGYQINLPSFLQAPVNISFQVAK